MAALIVVPLSVATTPGGSTVHTKHGDGFRGNARSVQHIANLEAIIVSVMLLAVCALHLA
jgi:hypothetical protein